MSFVATVIAVVMMLAVAASAALASPVTEVDSLSNTTAAPGGTHTYIVTLINVGDEPTPDGDQDFVADDPRLLTVSLPAGVTATSAAGLQWDCSATDFSTSPSSVSCINTMVADPNTNRISQTLLLATNVDAGVSGVQTATFDVTGGGAPPASTVDRTLFTPTLPPFGIDSFDGQLAANAAGDALTQAGGHPYSYSTTIFFNTLTNSIPRTGLTWPVEATKDISVSLPPGLVGAPTATGDSLCTLAQLSNSAQTVPKPLCSPGSQVGVAKIFTANGLLLTDLLPVYNMVPPPGSPARFGFNVSGTVTTLDASLRSGSDYGLTVNVHNLPEIAIAGTILTFWGVPADRAHDAQRACPGEFAPDVGGPSCTTEVTPKPFLRAPTSCSDDPLTTILSIDSWANPGVFKTATSTSHDLPGYPFAPGPDVGIDGCADVPFAPTFTAKPTPSAAAGEPSGFAFDLDLPQTDDPERISTGDLKKAVVTLPAGLRVSPSSADGLVACSAAQVALSSDGDAACPASSKIGGVIVDTPLLSDPLTGSVYLAKPHDNPFDSLLGIYIVARGPGVVVKLPGRVQADPVTGQLSTTFDNNPQLPFSHLHLEFKGGPRAPLVAPPRCGSYQTHAVLTSWSGATVASDSTFEVSQDGHGTPCAPPRFSPGFEAGGSSAAAGKNTTFSLRLSREDEDQEFKTISVSPPPGLLASLRGIPYCPESALDPAALLSRGGAMELASPSCPAASRLGTAVVGAGAGSNPFYVQAGKAYLAGPYKGAPLSLAVAVPALAGPFDLGTVMVRSAIHIDPADAHLTVRSDPLPTILQGIPLQVRDIRVDVDRPSFMINPTDCGQKQVSGDIASVEGATAQVASRFQVGGCRQLGFKPKLHLRLFGETRRGAYPKLRAVLSQKPGQANIRRVQVALPDSVFLANNHLNNICTRAQFAANDCPRGSIYGYAKAITPLLDEPLKGPVYLKSSDNLLPDLVARLDGQIQIDLTGRIDEVNGGIRNTFDVIPDAPVTKFILTMKGAGKGLLQNSRNICRQTYRATVKMDGQNGKVHDFRPKLRASCGKKAKKKGKRVAQRSVVR